MFRSVTNHLIRPFGMKLKYRKPEPTYPPYIDLNFVEIYERHCGDTMVSWPGCYQAFLAAQHVANNDIPGAIVQCGTWRGGLAAMIADTLAGAGDTEREIYLYDSFQGMPLPGEHDVKVSAPEVRAVDLYHERQANGREWAKAVAANVQGAMVRSGYPGRVHIIEGDVLETIPGDAPQEIALLHLDTDWYESTRHELEHLYPRLVPSGVLVVDDYRHWAGSRKAVDEYFSEQAMFLAHDSHYSSVTAVKPT